MKKYTFLKKIFALYIGKEASLLVDGRSPKFQKLAEIEMKTDKIDYFDQKWIISYSVSNSLYLSQFQNIGRAKTIIKNLGSFI